MKPEAFEAAVSLLPWPSRLEQMNRYRFEQDRARCLGAGLLLLYANRQRGLVFAPPTAEEHGRLCYEDHRFAFSLSHSGDYMVCAVLDAEQRYGLPNAGSDAIPENIGIDVECDRRVTKILDRVLTPVEKNWLASSSLVPVAAEVLPDADPASDTWKQDFLRLWTRKESASKYDGRGLGAGFETFSVSPDEDDVPGDGAEPAAGEAVDLPAGWSCHAHHISGGITADVTFFEKTLPTGSLCVCAPAGDRHLQECTVRLADLR